MKTANKTIVVIICLLLFFSSLISADGSDARNADADPGSPIVPIIMYHEVKTYKTGKDVITPYEFESDLKYLKDNDYTAVNMAQLIDYVYNNKALPEKPVVITFDDGYLNNYVYVFPLIKKYDMKIVLSIVGKNTDDFTRIPDSNLDYSHVTWAQINEMMQSGLVEIQNHTYNLHKITARRYGCQKKRSEDLQHYEGVLTEDIGLLQQEIRQNTGCTPTTFAYPYGRVSKESVPILKKLGFKASLTCDYGVNVIKRGPDALFGLRRICRAHGVNTKKLIREAMKTLKFRKTD